MCPRTTVGSFSLDVESNRDPQFTAWCAFFSVLAASVSLPSSFHPESNRQTECTNQSLESTLWCLASTNPSSWSRHLTCVKYAHNTLRNTSSRCLSSVTSRLCFWSTRGKRVCHLQHISSAVVGLHAGGSAQLSRALLLVRRCSPTGVADYCLLSGGAEGVAIHQEFAIAG